MMLYILLGLQVVFAGAAFQVLSLFGHFCWAGFQNVDQFSSCRCSVAPAIGIMISADIIHSCLETKPPKSKSMQQHHSLAENHRDNQQFLIGLSRFVFNEETFFSCCEPCGLGI
jgi:hypothetical protein